MSNSADEGWGLDHSEELDQLQAGDTLDDRGVEDILDEGIVTRERWSPGEGFGNTRAEMRQGETLAMRIAQEEPEPDPATWDDEDLDDREVGDRRAGRLWSDDGDGSTPHDDRFAHDAGIDGAAASAEEAAMHVIDEDEDW
ncbi:DUF5709 domain-containing protein [Nocardioides marmoribigeumensis]|uniref:DUF5709 domain-containing protein n=1 Tax=Nocardioides marmoribigeumensis TaxID=433649 RepID=A0ABU2BTL0_9ACTN|nr:DUF5709 domain-containing protein [Nocardioides marmoribigeumensis]MDR7361626.1 hypothetical protein [Nocardioides marmoribigeumensis]